VDRFAGAWSLRETYAASRQRWVEARERLREARRRLAEISEKEDWFRAQIEEIDTARLQPGEEVALLERRARAQELSRSSEARATTDRILFEEDGSALDRIETALDRLGKVAAEWDAFRTEIEAARAALRRAHRMLPDVEAIEDQSVAETDERLRLIGKLKKKYGGSEAAVLEHRSDLAAALAEAELLKERLAVMEEETQKERRTTADAAGRLRRARKEVRDPLVRAVMAEMKSLGMAGAVLDLVMEQTPAEGEESLCVNGVEVACFKDGVDRAWFRLRPNPGEGAGPLAAIASGGELSRSLLALLTVLGSREEPRSAIFDEIDAGIGGATARAVAGRLERLAADRQVLLVTHLPVIASRAGTQFRVEKKRKARRTLATIAPLDRQERIGELARMLAGQVDSKIARRHAASLLAGDATEEVRP
jgi:DNA repair protein RecN (Recombination protein N)